LRVRSREKVITSPFLIPRGGGQELKKKKDKTYSGTNYRVKCNASTLRKKKKIGRE